MFDCIYLKVTRLWYYAPKGRHIVPIDATLADRKSLHMSCTEWIIQLGMIFWDRQCHPPAPTLDQNGIVMRASGSYPDIECPSLASHRGTNSWEYMIVRGRSWLIYEGMFGWKRKTVDRYWLMLTQSPSQLTSDSWTLVVKYCIILSSHIISLYITSHLIFLSLLYSFYIAFTSLNNISTA